MKKTPTVTMAIVTRSREQSFLNLIRDISKQNHPPEQLIVVENTYEQKYGHKVRIESMLPRVRQVIYIPYPLEDKLIGPARNLCLTKASGEIFMFVDDDVRLAQDYVERVIKWFICCPNTLAVMPRIVSSSHDKWSKFSEAFFNFGQRNVDKPVLLNTYSFCACSINMRVYRGLDIKIDESLPAGEDYIFAKQTLLASQKKVWYLPELIVTHDFGESHPFQSFLNRFSWYGKGYSLESVKYPQLIKQDLGGFIENVRKLVTANYIELPVLFMKILVSEVKFTWKQFDLSSELLIPNIVYNLLAITSVWRAMRTDADFKG